LTAALNDLEHLCYINDIYIKFGDKKWQEKKLKKKKTEQLSLQLNK